MSSIAFFRRLYALIIKESRQLLRDKSSLAIGLVLPIILILIQSQQGSLTLLVGI